MNLIVAFGKQQNAEKIKRILTCSGYPVTAVCATGGQILERADELERGILICGNRFPDMMYQEILEELPQEFFMLLVARPEVLFEREGGRVFSLALPLQVHELLETVEMLSAEALRRKKSARSRPRERTEKDLKTIEEAKRLLHLRNGMSEEEAHRYIQRTSMRNGTDLVETAEMILCVMLS